MGTPFRFVSRVRAGLVAAVLGLSVLPVAASVGSAEDLGFVRVSVPDVTVGAVEANGPSWSPSVSDDGTRVAFVSAASNLVLGDTNGVADVFVRDRVADVARERG